MVFVLGGTIVSGVCARARVCVCVCVLLEREEGLPKLGARE